MLPADAGTTSEGRTAANNATVRTVFVIGPDKKIKLMLAYPMTTGRNFDQVLRPYRPYPPQDPSWTARVAAGNSRQNALTDATGRWHANRLLTVGDGNIRKLSFESNRINLQQEPTMTIIVDAHQHFWNYGTYQTSWMEKPPYAGDPTFASIRRSFGPDDLQPDLKAAGVSASITVQAADGPEENNILLRHAALTPWIAGVVGWIPLDRPDEAARMLEQFSREPKFVGVRHLINVEPDPDWIMRSAVIEGLSVLIDYNLTFDYVGILPRHLEHLPILAERLPTLRIVVDHLGKPPIAVGGFEPWASLLAAAAEGPNVFAKLSGLDAGQGDRWSASALVAM